MIPWRGHRTQHSVACKLLPVGFLLHLQPHEHLLGYMCFLVNVRVPHFWFLLCTLKNADKCNVGHSSLRATKQEPTRHNVRKGLLITMDSHQQQAYLATASANCGRHSQWFGQCCSASLREVEVSVTRQTHIRLITRLITIDVEVSPYLTGLNLCSLATRLLSGPMLQIQIDSITMPSCFHWDLQWAGPDSCSLSPVSELFQ